MQQLVLERVAEVVSGAPQSVTLETLVRDLAGILEVDCAFVAEGGPGGSLRLRIVACWVDDMFRADASYLELTDTVRLQLRNRSGWCSPEGAFEYCLAAPILRELGAESCAGVPLLDGRGIMVGLLVCASRKPFTNAGLVDNVMRIVALRATTELERQQADQSIRATEQRSELLLEDCQDAITLLNAQGERVYSSPTAATLLGYPPEVYERMVTFDTVHPEEVEHARALFTELVTRPGHRISAEVRCRHYDGSWRWIHTTSVNLLDQPDIGAIVCTWRDVTAQHAAAEALQAGEERFRGLVANIPGAVYRCGIQPDGLLIYVSDGIEAITGYPAADYIGNARRTFLTLIHPEEQERVVQQVLAAATAGKAFELEYRTIHRSGEIRWIRSRGRLVLSPDRVPLWVDGVLFDDTERRRQEQQFTEQNLALAHAAEGIGRVDATGYYLHVNPAYAEMLGRTPDELRGQCWRLTIHPDEWPRLTEAYAQMKEEGKAEIELLGLRADGSTFYQQLALVLTRDEAGLPNGHFCFSKDVTARREAEQALRRSEARFRALVEKASDVVAVLDAEGTIRYESPAIEKITGYTADELYETSILDLIHPEDVNPTRAAFLRLVENPGLSLELSYRVRHKSGGWRRLEAAATSLLDQPGVHGVVVNARDVTERQAAQAESRFQAAVLEALKEATLEGVLLVNPEGEILTCNRRFQDLWQLSDAVLAPRSDETALASAVQLVEQPQAYLEQVQLLMRTQEVSDDEIALRDGRVLERYGAPVRGEDGTLYGRVWRFREITDRKRAKRKDLAFQRLGQSLNTAATPVEAARVVLRVADELLGWDACWLDLFSDDLKNSTTLICQDQIDGERVELPVSPRKTPPGVMASQAIREGHVRVLFDPETLPPPDFGGTTPFGDTGRTSASILCVPIRSGERVVGAMSIQSYTFHAYDEAALATFQALADYCGGALERTLSEAARDALEQQLIQAQKMEAVGRLAGGVAHDFNNMLAVIGGYAEMLMMNAPPGHSTHGPLEQIKKASDRAAKLTQQLLAFSRKQILQPQVLNLNDVVLGVDRMLRRLIGEDIELVTLGDPGVRKIEADPGQIEQVLLNLAVNARDAMPEGGKLTLHTQNVRLDEEHADRLPGARPGAYVLLSVTDTGCGMDAETLERIFEPFYTTKELGKGTGLGLSTVYGIVSQSDGFIQVQSVPEQGTTFHIHFPAVDRPTTLTGPTDDELPQGARSRETVLVVEDEPMVRNLVVRVLETCGYEVQAAMHGDEALRIAAAHPGRIHLLLTDVVMPRMGGRELAERFRVLRPETKVLFMSGYTDDAVLRHGLAGIEAGFLQKPFSPQALARTVESLLHP